MRVTASAFGLARSHPLARANQRWSFLAAHQQPKNRPCHGAVMATVRGCNVQQEFWSILKRAEEQQHPNYICGERRLDKKTWPKTWVSVLDGKETRFRASVHLERRWYRESGMKFTMGFLRIGSMFMSRWVTMSVYEPSGCKNAGIAFQRVVGRQKLSIADLRLATYAKTPQGSRSSPRLSFEPWFWGDRTPKH